MKSEVRHCGVRLRTSLPQSLDHGSWVHHASNDAKDASSFSYFIKMRWVFVLVDTA